MGKRAAVVTLGPDVKLGPDHPVVIIAEIGVNHDGSVPKALELIDAAASAGADVIKFQSYVPEALCSPLHCADEIAMLQRYELAEEDVAALKAAVEDRGKLFLSTPFDRPSLAMLQRLGVTAFKVGSGELCHGPLLEELAGTGLPVILSSGASSLEDVERAVASLESAGVSGLCLLHCTSAYPAPDQAMNLRAMRCLAEHFAPLPVGLSDHSLGITAALGAVALGARVVEKHLTLSHDDPGPDHRASAEPAELAALVSEVRRLEAMLGDGEKRPGEAELPVGRSIVAARDLARGQTLKLADFDFKRPGRRGFPPWQAADLVGRRLCREVPRDELLHDDDLVVPVDDVSS